MYTPIIILIIATLRSAVGKDGMAVNKLRYFFKQSI